MLKKLFVVFLILSPKGTYSRCVLLYLILLDKWAKEKLPTMAMLHTGFSNFNEEDGELSFSVLSRKVIGDTCKASFSHLNNAYQSQNLLKSAASDLISDFGVFAGTSNHQKISPNAPEVKALLAFFKSAFQEIRANSFICYPPLKNQVYYEPKVKVLAAIRAAQLQNQLPASYQAHLTSFIPTSLPDHAATVLEDLQHLLIRPSSFATVTERQLHPPSPIETKPLSYSPDNCDISVEKLSFSSSISDMDASDEQDEPEALTFSSDSPPSASSDWNDGK